MIGMLHSLPGEAAQDTLRYEFTQVVARLVAVFGALVILAGCAAPEAREGVLLVSWMAPTTNTDGSPLTDLESYRLYFNTVGSPCPGGLSVTVKASAVGRTPDGRVSVILSNFVVGQIYHVALTAVNSQGTESACSETKSARARHADQK
jgi:hypothetical protein